MSDRWRAWACATGVLLWIAGCGSAGSTVAGEGGETAGGEQVPDWMASDDSAVSERMRHIAAGMRDAGLELGGLGGRGFLTQGERRTEALDVPQGTCATIVAIAARGVRDLDATLYSPAGDVLAEDIEPDAHPTVQVCAPGEARRLYYGLHAYAGAGAFLYASFVGDRESFEAAARVVGGRPGVVSEGAEGAGLDRRLSELRAGVARRGFRPHGDPAPVQLDADQRVRLPLRVERGHCYTVVALANGGLEDVDVRVLDELDRELASDVSPSMEASTQLCVDRDATLTAEVHAARGEGVAQVVYFEATESAAGGVSGLWLGERHGARMATAPADERAAAALARGRQRGWRSASELGRGTLAAGEAVEHRVRLPAGRCSLLVATGGRGVAALDLTVIDAEGRPLGGSTDAAATSEVRLCPDRSLEGRAVVVARRGAGDYRLHRLVRPAPAEVPGDAPAAVRGALLGALDEAAGDGWERLDGPRAVTLDAAGEATAPLPGGRCVRVLAAAAEPVTAELVRAERVAARSTGRAAWLLSCPDGRGEAPVLRLRGAAGAKPWLISLGRR